MKASALHHYFMRVGAAFQSASACLVLVGIWAAVVPIANRFAVGARIFIIDNTPITLAEELLYLGLRFVPPALAVASLPVAVALVAGVNLSVRRFAIALITVGTVSALVGGWWCQSRLVGPGTNGVLWEYVFSPLVGVPATFLALGAWSLWTRLRATPVGHCDTCRYDLSNCGSSTCPECGAPRELKQQPS